MPYILAIGAGVLCALLRGGRLGGLARLRFHSPLFLAAGALLWLLTSPLPLQTWLRLSAIAPLLLLFGHLLLLLFIWRNRQMPWLALVGFGLLLNVVVMVANGGEMPVDEALLRAAGTKEKTELLRAEGLWLHYRSITPETRLPFLGDVIYLTAPFPAPYILSPGDLIIAAGAFLVVHAAMLRPSQIQLRRLPGAR